MHLCEFSKAPEEFFYATLARLNQTLADTSNIVQQGLRFICYTTNIL